MPRESLPAKHGSSRGGTEYNRTIVHFFGPPFMAARALPLLIALALAWHLPQHRFWLGTAVLCILAAVAFTFAYVHPINAVLFEQAGGSHTPAEVASMVRRWIWADRIRFVVGVAAFAAILCAFRLPVPR